MIVALLGAESTGKTTLAEALAARLRAEGRDAVAAAETLREFCARERRTPRPDEQRAIAAEQTRRIAAARRAHALVVADTTALQTAVYSDYVFADRGLYAEAGPWHAAQVGLTLLTALDVPWQPDGHQRDGAHVRAPVDALLRAALARAGIAYSVVAGLGEARTEAALAALRHALRDRRGAAVRWKPVCERCGDPACERHALKGAARVPGS